MSPRSSRTATWTGRVGVLLVVAGLVLAGYVAWQLFGTNVASQRTHADDRLVAFGHLDSKEPRSAS